MRTTKCPGIIHVLKQHNKQGMRFKNGMTVSSGFTACACLLDAFRGQAARQTVPFSCNCFLLPPPSCHSVTAFGPLWRPRGHVGAGRAPLPRWLSNALPLSPCHHRPRTWARSIQISVLVVLLSDVWFACKKWNCWRNTWVLCCYLSLVSHHASVYAIPLYSRPCST